MTFEYNIKKNLSQPYFLIISLLVVFLFVLLLLINATPNSMLIMGISVALLPLFFTRPVYFLYFIFLVTPSLRTIAKTDIIWQGADFAINYNTLINFLIIFFGCIILLDHRRKLAVNIRNNKFTYLILIFIALIMASLFYYSIDKQKTFEEMIRIGSIFILFLYAFIVIENKKSFYGLLIAIIAGALLPALIGVYQLATGGGWYDKTIFKFRVNGTFLHPATFAFYLLFTLPILYPLMQNIKLRLKKFIFFLAAVLFTFLIIATLTRGAWLGLLTMVIAYGILKSRKFLMVVLIAVLASYLIVPTIKTRVNDIFDPKYNSSFTTRLLIIRTALPAFYQKPFLGSGFGTFENIHLKYNPEAVTYESLQAHNDYLRILIELGGLGLVIYFLIFASLFWRVISLYRKSDSQLIKNHLYSLIILWLGALAVATGDNLLRTMEVQYLIWTYTGAVLAIAVPPLLNKERVGVR